MTQKKTIIILVLTIITLASCELIGLTQLNAWRNTFWTAVENRAVAQFIPLVGWFTVWAFLLVTTNALSHWMELKLGSVLRAIKTEELLPYAQFLYPQLDNVCQRIADDVRILVQNAIPLFVGLLFSLIKFVIFICILMKLSVLIIGNYYTVPASLITFASVSLLLVFLISRNLIKQTFELQKVEANFRYGLALQRAGNDDKQHDIRFTEILKQNVKVFRANFLVNFSSQSVEQAAVLIPILLLVPAFLANPVLALGVLMQAISAAGEATNALMYITTRFDTITIILASHQRIKQMNNLLRGVQ